MNSGNLVRHSNKWQVPVNIVKTIRVPHIVWNILDNKVTHRFSEAHKVIE